MGEEVEPLPGQSPIVVAMLPSKLDVESAVEVREVPHVRDGAVAVFKEMVTTYGNL